MMVDTECGAQGTPRHGDKGHSFNRTLPYLPIPVIMWNNRPGASPTPERRTPAEATMRTTPVPRTTTGGPQLRIRVAVTVSLERPHLAVQHLIQPDGNLQGPGRAAGPHLPRPDGPLLPGLGQAVGPHSKDPAATAHRPGQADGRPLLPHINDPANQTVQRPGQADGHPLPLPFNPAKQTGKPADHNAIYHSTPTTISAAGIHRSPRRSSRSVPSRFRRGGDKYISLSASLHTTSKVYR